MADVSFRIDIDNTDAIKRLTEDAICNALEIVGAKGADYAAALAPVDTGNLKNSLTHEVNRGEKQVIIGTNVEYAAPVELGHIQEVGRFVPAIGKRLVNEHVAPQPFLRPAMQNHIDEYKQIINSELKNSLT